MNIESKRYALRSIGGGLLEARNKETGQSVTLEAGEMPDVGKLAAMHERTFDRLLNQFV